MRQRMTFGSVSARSRPVLASELDGRRSESVTDPSLAVSRGRLVAEVRDQTRGGVGSRVVAVGLLPQAVAPVLVSQSVAVPHLE
jgi:hypothetical protein